MQVGLTVKVRTKPDGTRIYGKVVYIHPRKRYAVVEISVRGGVIREVIYPRWRQIRTPEKR